MVSGYTFFRGRSKAGVAAICSLAGRHRTVRFIKTTDN